MTAKRVLGLHPAKREDIGDLVTYACIPPQLARRFDPFLFLAHHGPQVFPPGHPGLPFGPHPHRGFETVTFILDGAVMHRDNRGHESVIRDGGVQWMTAGSGIVHAEQTPLESQRAGGPMEILQLWVNLPSKLKMSTPRYQGLQRGQMPAVASSDGKASVRLISGEWGGATGPVESLTGVFMASLAIEAGGKLAFDGLEGRSVFFYVVSGAVRVNGTEVPHHATVEFDQTGGAVEIEALHDARVLFGHGAAINEPIASYGPFVMTSELEIRQAIMDYQAGKFGPEMA